MIFYLLVCRVCDPEAEAPIPFGSPDQRGRWASEHTAGTGHDHWLVLDHEAGRLSDIDTTNLVWMQHGHHQRH